jgi:Tfp pilus assembly protein PilN
MRPVNLIPPEERRGDKAPMRTGSLGYVVVAGLGAALLAVTGVVLTNNQISDRKSEKAGLETQVAEAQAQADRLGSFASFASMQQAREQTVESLAKSRFDWERVLRELAIVIPGDVWLTNLSASVSADASAGTASSGSSTASGAAQGITGPSLDIQGCAGGHEGVARFLSALRDIDGVTRVSVLNSDLPDPGAGGVGTGAVAPDAGGGGTDCATRDFVSQFEVVAAFDEVQVDSTTQGLAPAPSAPTDQSQVADADQQQAADQQQDSAGQQAQSGRNQTQAVIPGTGTAP